MRACARARARGVRVHDCYYRDITASNGIHSNLIRDEQFEIAVIKISLLCARCRARARASGGVRATHNRRELRSDNRRCRFTRL